MSERIAWLLRALVLVVVGGALLWWIGLWPHPTRQAPDGPVRVSGWKVWRVPAQEAGGTAVDMARLDASQGQNWLNKPFQLVLRCRVGKSLDAYVDWHLLISQGAPPVMRWQVGDASPQAHRWVTSGDGTATFANDPHAMLEVLAGGGRAWFQVKDASGKPHRAVFTLGRSANALAAIRRDCGHLPPSPIPR